MNEEQRKDAMRALGRIVLSIEGLKMDYKQDVQTIIYALQSPHPDDQELINTKSNLEHSMAFARDLSHQIDAMKQELAQTKLELARSRKQKRVPVIEIPHEAIDNLYNSDTHWAMVSVSRQALDEILKFFYTYTETQKTAMSETQDAFPEFIHVGDFVKFVETKAPPVPSDLDDNITITMDSKGRMIMKLK